LWARQAAFTRWDEANELWLRQNQPSQRAAVVIIPLLILYSRCRRWWIRGHGLL
jgi:hypothetical protein